MKPKIETLGPDEFDYDEDTTVQAVPATRGLENEIPKPEDTAKFYFHVRAPLKAGG